MPSLIALIAALLVGAALVVGARFWFSRVQKRKAIERIGIEVMASRSWKDGVDLLARAVTAEGGWQIENLASPQGQPTPERLLIHGDRRALLVYKHGTNYRIGTSVLVEGERRRQDVGASELWVATLGTVEPAARTQAERTGVTLLDGPALWARASSALEPRIRSDVEREAEDSVKRPRDIATLAGTVLVLALVVVNLPDQLLGGGSDVAAPTASAPRAAAPAPRAAPTQDENEMGETTREARRAALAAELVDVEGVLGAAWSSNTTMVISLSPAADIDAVFVQACTLSAQYVELTESRLQFESDDPTIGVRWRRCA